MIGNFFKKHGRKIAENLLAASTIICLVGAAASLFVFPIAIIPFMVGFAASIGGAVAVHKKEDAKEDALTSSIKSHTEPTPRIDINVETPHNKMLRSLQDSIEKREQFIR